MQQRPAGLCAWDWGEVPFCITAYTFSVHVYQYNSSSSVSLNSYCSRVAKYPCCQSIYSLNYIIHTRLTTFITKCFYTKMSLTWSLWLNKILLVAINNVYCYKTRFSIHCARTDHRLASITHYFRIETNISG